VKRAKLLALLAAGTVTVLVFFFFNMLSVAGGGKTTEIVTAAVNIPANTSITKEMILIKDVPEGALVAGAVESQELVLGKVTKNPIFIGEQILDEKLILPGAPTNKTLAYAIEPGMRAITVSVDANSGLSGMLKPQNRVDLICDFEYEASSTEIRSYTTLVAENVKLLAVDDILSEQGKTGTEQGVPSYATITLEVTQKQSMEISMAVYKGQLRAVLRSPVDEAINNLPNLAVENMMNN